MRKLLVLFVCVLLLVSGCTSHEERLIKQAEERQFRESEHNDAYQEGYEAAREYYSSSYDNGYDDGYNEGFEEGYDQRYRDAFGEDYDELIYDLFERRLTDPDEWKAFKAEAKRWDLSF